MIIFKNNKVGSREHCIITHFIKSRGRFVFHISLVLIFGMLSCSGIKLTAEKRDFDEGWQFNRSMDTAVFPAEQAIWENVDLPHTSRLEPLTVTNQWQGICFYRKQFRLSNQLHEKELSMQFDGAMNVADIWINGHKMVHHEGGFLPFVIDLTTVARFDTLNTILVRLDNRDNPVTGPKPLKILDFNTYGGLYRNVYLIVKEKVHLSNPIERNLIGGGGVFFATTMADKHQAGFEIRSHVENLGNGSARMRVDNQLIDQAGKVVCSLQSPEIMLEAGQSTLVSQNGNLEQPALWSPANPNLYILKTDVYANGKLTDSQTDRVGLRYIHITPEGLWLNGEKTFLRGVNRHQEYPYIGYALSDAAQYRDAWKIKQAGFDYVRCSHYPMSPAFLNACDELGIMVLDAILGWQYFGDKRFEAHALRSSRELIRRDRNHPCVLAWELSINESEMPVSFTDSAQVIAHEEYPYASSYSAGWVRSSYDIYIEARQHRHGLYPDKPLIVSEYGDWEYFAQNAGFNQQAWKDLLTEERNSRQPRDAGEKRLLQQALNIQEAHNDNLSTHALADGYWVMFDYNRGMASEQEYSGVMDIFRLPKFSYYFFRSQRDIFSSRIGSEPMVCIASYWQPGISKGIRVYSNCEEVEVWVDGVSLGRHQPDKNSISSNLFHPPFTFDADCVKPGLVKAVGYSGGKAVVFQTLATAGMPAQLDLKIDESGKSVTTNDVIMVYARILDDKQTIVPDDSREITFEVEGAKIAGPSTIHAQAGIATILLKTGMASGKIQVTARAKGLKSKSLKIQLQ